MTYELVYRVGLGNAQSPFRVIAQPEGRLCLSRRLLLAKNVGHVIGAEGACRGSFLDGIGDRFGSILADQFQQFGVGDGVRAGETGDGVGALPQMPDQGGGVQPVRVVVKLSNTVGDDPAVSA